jgi:hypothetical protein
MQVAGHQPRLGGNASVGKVGVDCVPDVSESESCQDGDDLTLHRLTTQCPRTGACAKAKFRPGLVGEDSEPVGRGFTHSRPAARHGDLG